jgi:hypothetical protein
MSWDIRGQLRRFTELDGKVVPVGYGSSKADFFPRRP